MQQKNRRCGKIKLTLLLVGCGVSVLLGIYHPNLKAQTTATQSINDCSLAKSCPPLQKYLKTINAHCHVYSQNTCVDWLQKKIYSLGRLPEKQWSTNQYSDQNTSYQNAKQSLSKTLRKIFIDDRYTIQDSFFLNRRLQTNIQQIEKNIRSVRSPLIHQGTAEKELLTFTALNLKNAYPLYHEYIATQALRIATLNKQTPPLNLPVVSYVVLDAQHLMLNPSMFPKMRNLNNELLFDPQTTALKRPEQQPEQIRYITSIAQIPGNLVGAPLIIKTFKLYGKNATDLVFAAQDANTLIALEQQQKIFSQGRIFVLIRPDLD